MTIRSSGCVNASASVNASTSTNSFIFFGLILSPSSSLLLYASICLIFSLSAGLFPSPSAGFLMPVVQNISKLFYIGKPVISADNSTAFTYIKRTL